jgi:hypothetical protein
MKVEDYVSEYNLRETFRFDRIKFVVDFMADFDACMPKYAGTPDMSYDYFQDKVSIAKNFWDSIFIDTKVSKDHADKFWGFVYASEIIPRRNKFVPKYPKDFKKSVEEPSSDKAL